MLRPPFGFLSLFLATAAALTQLRSPMVLRSPRCALAPPRARTLSAQNGWNTGVDETSQTYYDEQAGESQSELPPQNELDPATDALLAQRRKAAQTEVLDRAGDPFRAIRLVVFVIFAVVGLAGCGVSILQMGQNPSSALGNLAVNAAVLGAGVGVFIFDRKIQANLKAKLEEDLNNPYLKGSSEFYFNESEDAPPPPA